MHPRAYAKVIEDFGFSLLEYREFEDGFVGIAMEKVEDFNPDRMRKLQLVKQGELFVAKNLVDGDWTFR